MKKQIISALIDKINNDLLTTLSSAQAAHEAATSTDSKAENKYDTRGLEAGYLAEAQMKRAAQYEKQISFLTAMAESLKANTEVKQTTVCNGCLVKVAHGSRNSSYFILNDVGGTSLQVEGTTIHVISPQSPLGDALLNHEEGDTVEVELQGTLREYRIIEII